MELSVENMKKYIGGLVVGKTMLQKLQDELDKGSKTIYLEAMEARVRYQKDIIKQFGDIIAQYQAWYQCVSESHQVEVVELVFPQTCVS